MYWVVSWQWFQRLSMQCQRWNYIWIGNHKPYLLGCGGNPSNHHQLPYNDEIIFRWQYPQKHCLYCNHFHYLHMLKNLLVLVQLSGFQCKGRFRLLFWCFICPRLYRIFTNDERRGCSIGSGGIFPTTGWQNRSSGSGDSI